MASIAKRQAGEVFGAQPPRDRQFRIVSVPTKFGHMVSLRITHYGDDEYLVEGTDRWSCILFGGIRENDSYIMLLYELEREVMDIEDHNLKKTIKIIRKKNERCTRT